MMATIKKTKVESKENSVKKAAKKAVTEKYFYAIGRRKDASATVRLFEGTGDNIVNGKPLKEFFPVIRNQKEVVMPLTVLEKNKNYYFTAKAKGGGVAGQVGAIILGLSRALVIADESYRSTLKSNSFLRRDSRMVERKHTGFRKARKSEQFSKR